MSDQKQIFGIENKDIKKTCVIAPFIPKDILKQFGITELIEGKFYATGMANDFALIRTGIGPALVNDAILHLKDTPCEEIILFGSCTITPVARGLNIGDIVCPTSSLSLDDFSRALMKPFESAKKCEPNEELLKTFYKNTYASDIKQTACASFGSIDLEKKYLDFFTENNIQTIDIESASFLNSAVTTKKRALALLFVSDIISVDPLYEDKDVVDQLSINSAMKRTVDIIKEFASTLNPK